MSELVVVGPGQDDSEGTPINEWIEQTSHETVVSEVQLQAIREHIDNNFLTAITTVNGSLMKLDQELRELIVDDTLQNIKAVIEGSDA